MSFLNCIMMEFKKDLYLGLLYKALAKKIDETSTIILMVTKAG